MNIRTKIIGGYLLLVALVLSYLALNDFVSASAVKEASSIYSLGEDIRLEMEAENFFWRQIISSTEYLRTTDEANRKEAEASQKEFVTRIEQVQKTIESEAEGIALKDLMRRYELYASKSNEAISAHALGKTDKAIEIQSQIDSLEQDVDHALGGLVDQKRIDVSQYLDRVRSRKWYAFVLPALAPTIERAEIIKTQSASLQHLLGMESDYLRQDIALRSLFLFNHGGSAEEFNKYQKLFDDELRAEKALITDPAEWKELDAIGGSHRKLADAFVRTTAIYQTGDTAAALRLENDLVRPAAEQLDKTLVESYPDRQEQMDEALDETVLASHVSQSLTGSLALWVGLISLGGLALGAVIAVKITAPVRRLVGATASIASGDFTVDLEVRGRDEVAHLTDSFNRMAKELHSTTVSRDYVDGILSSMSDSLVVTSESGEILTVNPATTAMLGYSEAELIGKQLDMLFAKDDSSGDGDAPIRLFDAQEAFYLAKDGRRIPVSISRASLRLDHGAQGMVCVAKDVTDRKRAEEALRRSEHKLSLHIRRTPLAVIEWNLEGEIVEWNPAAEIVFGYSRREMLGRRMTGFLVPESERETVEREWDDLLSGRTGQHKTTYNITKDGRTIICDWYNTPLDSEGRVIGVASMVQDFTDRVRMERELQEARDSALRSAQHKSLFLANMSHEIRTPMNGIIGMTGLLLDTALTSDQRDFAETIRSCGDALLTIINDILDFSKIEAGKLQFETLDFDLRLAVEGSLELLAERARQNRVELASLVYTGVPTALRGDPGRLRQVLINLISNAVKFSEDGEVLVLAEKESESEEKVVIRFSIKDNGIGISDEAQQGLFQAFTQADDSTTRKYGGTGLGLAISRQLVELMDGQIGVTSALGVGSTFWFTTSFEKQSNASDAESGAPDGLRGLRVLVADNHSVNRTVLGSHLESWGITSVEAQSSMQALEMLRTAASTGEPYDVAIVDSDMPDMDGMELTRAVKTSSDISRTNIVLLIYQGQYDRETGSAEISAYLTKPIRQSSLLACLQATVSPAYAQAAGQPVNTTVRTTSFAEPPAESARAVSGKRVLVAEDNVINQKIAIRQLEKLGYHADGVANGKEALEALDRIPYALILMDCQMPEMDGYRATAEIRRREGDEKHVTIVAMTASALESDRRRCLEAGMDDFISKPVLIDDLDKMLRQFFAGKD